MTVRWTPTSLRDLGALHSYISEDNATAALYVVETLLKVIAVLTRNPEMGRTRRFAGFPRIDDRALRDRLSFPEIRYRLLGAWNDEDARAHVISKFLG